MIIIQKRGSKHRLGDVGDFSTVLSLNKDGLSLISYQIQRKKEQLVAQRREDELSGKTTFCSPPGNFTRIHIE